MTRARAIAAIASVLTVLLLQATLVGPLTGSVPVSLPAVLVAAVALRDGVGAGMSVGFSAGLLADLASTHPAGILAVCWLGLGMACGLAGRQGSLRRDAFVAALACALTSVVATLLLALTSSDGATVGQAFRGVLPAFLGDALLALLVVAVVRRFLRNPSLTRHAEPQVNLGGPFPGYVEPMEPLR